MATFEEEHVHQVYEVIAQDFSRTRHTRWPFCQRFLEALPAGSVVLDAGCGNGKYLPVRSILPHPADPADTSKSSIGYLAAEGSDPERASVPTLLNIGLDMSQGLLGVAGRRGHEVVRGDCFDLGCWREGAFDHAISIAIIHHFSTVERRCEAIKQLIRAVTPPKPRHTPSTSSSTSDPSSSTAPSSRAGTFIASVWSLEQDPALVGVGSARRKTRGKKGAIAVNPDALPASASPDTYTPHHAPPGAAGDLDGDENPRGADDDESVQDVFVSWALQAAHKKRERKEPPRKGEARKVPYTGPRDTEGKKARRKREKEELESGSASSRAGEEERVSLEGGVTKLSLEEAPARPPAPEPVQHQQSGDQEEGSEEAQPTYLRYYHLFRHGEMSGLVARAAAELGIALVDASPDSIARLPGNTQPVPGGEQREGGRWARQVELKAEVWERENWCIHVGVSWLWR